MNLMYSFFLILFFSNPFKFLPTLSTQTGTLQINIQHIQDQKGTIKVALFNSEETFLKDSDAYLTNSISVHQNNTVEVVFKDLPFDTYTAAIFHDVNSNNSLDKNFLGVPKEPYGFSNNAKSKWGPPKYEDAKFELSQAHLLIQLDVKRWSQQ